MNSKNHAKNSTGVVIPTPTLDLHGYRRDRALQEMAQFLHRHQQQQQPNSSGVVVHLITGLGQHSSQHDGPVLRHCVAQYLQRHQFQYTWQRGVFVVAVHSGQLRYQRQECDTDTKLIVVAPAAVDDHDAPNEENRPVTTMKRRRRRPHHNTAAAVVGGRRTGRTQVVAPSDETTAALLLDPTLLQVVRDEAQVQRGKEESLQTFRLEQQQRQQQSNKHGADDDDNDALLQALQISAQLEQQQQREEQALIAKAVAQEQELLQRQQQQEQDELLQALEWSEHDYEAGEQEEDYLLQQALQMSQQEAVASHSTPDDEEWRMLQQALEQSRQETTRRHPEEEEDKELEKVLQQQIQHLHQNHNSCSNHDPEEWLLQNVIQLSQQDQLQSAVTGLKDTTPVIQLDCSTDDEDDRKLAALRVDPTTTAISEAPPSGRLVSVCSDVHKNTASSSSSTTSNSTDSSNTENRDGHAPAKTIHNVNETPLSSRRIQVATVTNPSTTTSTLLEQLLRQEHDRTASRMHPHHPPNNEVLGMRASLPLPGYAGAKTTSEEMYQKS